MTKYGWPQNNESLEIDRFLRKFLPALGLLYKLRDDGHTVTMHLRAIGLGDVTFKVDAACSAEIIREVLRSERRKLIRSEPPSRLWSGRGNLPMFMEGEDDNE